MRTALLYLGFALTGVVTTVLGPLLPTLIATWRVDDAAAGTLFTAQFAGALVGLAAASALVRRFGAARLLVVGFVSVAASVLGLAAGSLPVARASVFLYGAGLSFAIPTINLSVAAANPRRKAEALNVLNFVWGAGALASPVLVWAFVRFGVAWPVGAIAGLCAIVAAGLALVPGPEPERKAAETAAGAPRERIWRNPLLTLSCAVSFLYVGAENAIAGWVAVYVGRVGGPRSGGALAVALFWAALLAARAAAPLALARTTPRRLVLGALALSTAATAVLAGSSFWIVTVAAAALAGAGFATVYPTMLAIYAEHFGDRGERAISLVFACATLGGAALPWCVGAISASSGELRTGLFVPVAACALMLALEATVRPDTARNR